MSANNKDLQTANGKIAPQFYDASLDAYVIAQGDNGVPLMQIRGSFFRLSSETKPTSADGVKDGDDLLIVDTKDVYIYYKGTWYLQ
jgi:hypothetical protein